MRVLCTMPGKHGDILWALPTVRAIAELAEEPVDLMVAAPYVTLVPLLQSCAPYIRVCYGNTDWHVQDTAPMTPPRPAMKGSMEGYEKIVHLGYETWPMSLLPADIYVRGTASWGSPLPTLDLDTPWLTQPEWTDTDTTGEFGQSLYSEWGEEHHPAVHIGWSDEHVELKAGLIYAMAGQLGCDLRVVTPVGSRLATEWLSHFPGDHDSFNECFENISWYTGDWRLTAHALANSSLFVGCLSAQWVLANALGIRTVIVEPAEARHNAIFFYNHPRNTMLMGGDRKPTFDARHLIDKVREKLDRGQG